MYIAFNYVDWDYRSRKDDKLPSEIKEWLDQNHVKHEFIGQHVYATKELVVRGDYVFKIDIKRKDKTALLLTFPNILPRPELLKILKRRK